MKDAKVTVRIEQGTKEKLEQIVQGGKYENESQAIRAALREFLTKESEKK